MNDQVAPSDEYDDGQECPVPGRTYEADVRISVHEAGHAVAARLLGHSLGGATVDPGPGYDGRVWGEGHMEALKDGTGDATHIRETLAPMMPKAGEDHGSVEDIFGSVYGQIVELMAGRAAERILLEGEPEPPADDLRQARELALLICHSEQAIDTLIAHCDVATRDLLMPYGDVLIVLSTALRMNRTLDGAEIDEVISDVLARKVAAAEHQRRVRLAPARAGREPLSCESVIGSIASFTPRRTDLARAIAKLQSR
ncbi:hypothetical protein [Bradyrhizobium genosp. P]|uniref:hypothetical protein n=1 Tax=Bradyrhizobium genosp. P TaxID=83641 RepID=UPI003CED6468